MRLDEIRTSITNLIVFLRLNSLNSKCVLNIGNGPQSDPLLHSGVKDRQTAHQFTIEPKAAKRPISVQCGQKPQSGSLLCREAFIRYLVHFRFLLNWENSPISGCLPNNGYRPLYTMTSHFAAHFRYLVRFRNQVNLP